MVASDGSACGKGAREQNVSVIHGTSLTGRMQGTKPQPVDSNSCRSRSAALGDVVPDHCISHYVRQQLCLPDPPTPYLFKPLDIRQTRGTQAPRNGVLRGCDQAKSVLQVAPEGDPYNRVCTIDGRVLACEQDTGPLAFNEDFPDGSIHELAFAPFSVPYGILSYHNVKSKRRFCTPPSRPEHLRQQLEVLDWEQHRCKVQQHGDPPPSAQTKLCIRQTANHSIGTLLAHETLLGPVQQDAATPSLLFSGIPTQYNCHSSMRRISWQRTVRSAMAAADRAQQRRNADGQPWVSPAQLAAYSMALQLPPPAGFKHPLLRYPAGCGFTQRGGYPFSAAPAQLWANPADPHPDAVDCDAPPGPAPVRVACPAQTSCASDALFLDSGLGALSDRGRRGAGGLPQIAEELSEDGLLDSDPDECGVSTRSNSCTDRGAPRGRVSPGDPPAWHAPRFDDCSATRAGAELDDECHAAAAGDCGEVEPEDSGGCEERQLVEAGGYSLAGPAPVEAQVAQRPFLDSLRPSPTPVAQQDTRDGAGAAEEARMEVVIQQRGTHGPVLARVAGRPELQYAALEYAGDASADNVALGAAQAEAAEGGHPAGDPAHCCRRPVEINMLSWINDLAVARQNVGCGGAAAARQCHETEDSAAQPCGGLMLGSGGGGQDDPGMGGWDEGPRDDALEFMYAPAAGHVKGGEHSSMSLPQTLQRLEPSPPDDRYDGWSEVAMRLSPINQETSYSRPRMSDAAPATSRLPAPAHPAAEEAWRQVLRGGAVQHPGSELSIVRPHGLDPVAAIRPSARPGPARTHGQGVAERQLPPITPCTTPAAALDRRPPSVGGTNCGSGLGDRAGSLTVKLTSSTAAGGEGGADGGSPLWKLLPQQAVGELVCEASQRRLELAEESLRCMHDNRALQGAAGGGGPGGAACGKAGVLPRLAKDVDELLRHDAGLRMALALQGKAGAAGVQVQARPGGLKMQRSRAPAGSLRKESAIAAWKG